MESDQKIINCLKAYSNFKIRIHSLVNETINLISYDNIKFRSNNGILIVSKLCNKYNYMIDLRKRLFIEEKNNRRKLVTNIDMYAQFLHVCYTMFTTQFFYYDSKQEFEVGFDNYRLNLVREAVII